MIFAQKPAILASRLEEARGEAIDLRATALLITLKGSNY